MQDAIGLLINPMDLCPRWDICVQSIVGTLMVALHAI